MTNTWLLIPAAGSGQRFGGPLAKQFLTIGDRTVLGHVLQAFNGLVAGCTIAAQSDGAEAIAAIIEHDAPFPCTVVTGGATRQDSVAAALRAVPDGIDQILVHDAARPCIHPDDIRACIAALAAHPACVLARPCANTVKRVAGHQIVETVPRDDLWLAETPQCFRRQVGEQAMAAAVADRWQGTDDVALIERIGLPVTVIPAGHPNPKLTQADDAALIAALLKKAQGSAET